MLGESSRHPLYSRFTVAERLIFSIPWLLFSRVFIFLQLNCPCWVGITLLVSGSEDTFLVLLDRAFLYFIFYRALPSRRLLLMSN